MIKVVNIKEFIGHRQAIYSLAHQSEDSFFYSGGADGMLVKWDFESAEGLLIAQHEHAIYVVASIGDLILTGTNQGELTVFESSNYQLVKKLKWSSFPIFDIQWFNGLYYVASANGAITVLDKQFNKVNEIQLSTKSLRQLLPVNNELIAVGSEPAMWVLSSQNDIVKKYSDFDGSLFSVLFHPKSQTIVTGGRGAILHFLNNSNSEIQIKAHLLHIHSLSLHPEQNLLLSSSMDKTIKLWDFENKTLLKVIDKEKYNGHTSSVNKILWFDRNRFISCSDDRTIKCFEIIQP